MMQWFFRWFTAYIKRHPFNVERVTAYHCDFIFGFLTRWITSANPFFIQNKCDYEDAEIHVHVMLMQHFFRIHWLYRVAPQKNSWFFFRTLGQLSFFTLLDRQSFPHYNNTKIIKFGWELFILWVISYGLSFSGFVINRASELWKSGNPENDSPY